MAMINLDDWAIIKGLIGLKLSRINDTIVCIHQRKRLIKKYKDLYKRVEKAEIKQAECIKQLSELIPCECYDSLNICTYCQHKQEILKDDSSY